MLATASSAWAVTWTSGDIGAVQASGSYTQNGSTFTVMGSGADIWGTADQFQFVSTPLTGDGSITARVVSQTNTNPWAKAGVMIRESLSAGSTYAAVEVTPAEGVSLQDRTLTNSSALSTLGPFTKAPYWVRVVRAGNTFSGYSSADGVTWKLIGTASITMASQVFMGMAVCAHNNPALSTAVFDNVTVVSGTAPPPDTQAPTVPTGLAASNVTATGATLSWAASTDLPNPGGAGVGGYFVYRNGNTTTPVGTITSGTSFTDSALTAATTYTYQVAAFDKASPANVSAPSTAISVTTQAAGTTVWTSGDVGAVQASGTYTQNGSTFTVQGSGADIWGTADQFQFVSTPLTGDGSITARVVSQTNTNAWAKAGVMIRETRAAGSTYTAVEVTPAEGVAMQDRTLTNSSALSTVGPFTKAPYWVRVVRSGNTFSGFSSADGVTWKLVTTTTITMASQVFMGMAVCAHNNGVLSTVVFDNVAVVSGTAPPADTQAPTVPTGLTATNVTATGIALSWTASTDLPNPGGTGVGGYFVYRNGNTTTPVGTVTSGTSFTDSALTAATTYTYQVAAFDKATPANVSAPSSVLSVTTQSGGGTPTWTGGDVGAVAAAGSFTQSGGTFTVKGSGADIFGTADEFQFVSAPLLGDGMITARVVSQTNTNVWAKAGVMIRETLEAGSKYAAVEVTPAEGIAYQARTVTNGSAVSTLGPFLTAPYWVRVVRAGSTFSGYTSADGVTWKLVGTYTITMATQVYAGLIVSSHNNGVLSTAVFDNVSAPAANPNAVAVTPRNAALTLTQSQQFNVSASGGGPFTWSVDGINGGNGTVGTISATGLYVPPATAGAHTVKAAVTAQPANFATAAVAVTDLAGVYTYHMDLARTGLNTHEYALTPATARSPTFGRRWSCAVDGDIYAQPLYVANLAIGGGTHNVVFIVTMHDSVYALDADSPGCVTYWHVSFLGTGITTVSETDTSCDDVPGEYGITGTPVIDPASRTIYLVSKTKENGVFFQRLHALNIQTGAEQAGSPVVIQGSVPRTGGTVAFNPLFQNQRGGLVLSNGAVYIIWSSHCDHNTWYGWMMRYDATSLAQTAVFNSTPDGSAGGIWMAGGAPAVDSTGSLFFSTGNGTFDDTSGVVPPASPKNDFGMSFLKLNPTSLTVEDFYTPSQEAAWSNADLDIASSGVVVLPDGAGPTGHPNVLVGSDKQGHLWMIDRTQMSRFSSTSDNVVQFLTVPPGCGEECMFSTPALWNNTIYLGLGFGNVSAFPLSGGLIPAGTGNVATPSSRSVEKYGFPGPTPMISAAATSNGVVWTLDNRTNGTGSAPVTGPAVLRAYDALDLSKTLYDSSATSDTPGNAIKFTVPMIANGHVYVGGRSKLTVYGLAP
ncbi:MAG TPA: fibronectin type III domain-containing protein [Steroidobacteraceae bacterium]|nr:fibronectin type III domain-containing protein [Steroidobacteraceae bacterium]